MVLETRVLELTRENSLLKTELFAIKDKFGLPQNQQFADGDRPAGLIALGDNRGRRDKLLKTLIGAGKKQKDLKKHRLYISSGRSLNLCLRRLP